MTAELAPLLAKVMAEHADCGIVNPDGGDSIRLTCGGSVPRPAPESTIGWVDLHRTHVAAAQAAALEPSIAEQQRDVIELLGHRLDQLQSFNPPHGGDRWAQGYDDGWSSARLQINDSILIPRVAEHIRAEAGQ